jgi:hypothetical protein
MSEIPPTSGEEKKGFNERRCINSIFSPEEPLRIWPMRAMTGSYGKPEKKFLGPQFVVEEKGFPYVSLSLRPEQVNDIIEELDVNVLLLKSKEEHQVAVGLLGEAFKSAAKYNCVYKESIEKIDGQLKKPGELLSFQQDLRDFYNKKGDHFIILQKADDNFILVRVDPNDQNVGVLNMDEWFKQSPDEVKTMLISYYTHEARAYIASTAAYYLELHRIINQPDVIPPILWKVASIDDDEIRAKRLEELKTYVFLMDRVRIVGGYPLWYRVQQELTKSRSFKIGSDGREEVYSLERALSHLSKCGGIDPKNQEQYKKLLRALEDILSLNPDRSPSIPYEDLSLLQILYFTPLDELENSVNRENAMLNFLKPKAENMPKALKAPQSPEIVQQALVSPDDLKKTFPEMKDLLNSFKEALGGESEWDRFIRETSSSISTALILSKNDSKELLTRIRETVERKVADISIGKTKSFDSVGYSHLIDMLCIMMLSAGITAEPGNEGKLENLQYLYQLLKSDYEEKLRRDTDELKRQRVKNDRFLQKLEEMGLTPESYRNLLDPLVSLLNGERKVNSEEEQYFLYLDASRIIFPLFYMAMKKIADVTAEDSLLGEVLSIYLRIDNAEGRETVKKVFSNVQDIVRQAEHHQQ